MFSDAYRYYRLDGGGRLQSAEWLDADCDENAVAKIESRHPAERCEVWQGRRLVATLSPTLLGA